MNKDLLNKIVAQFGTAPVENPDGATAKVLLHPDDRIAVYFVNADAIKEPLQSRGYRWEPRLSAWMKKVDTLEEALAETHGYPATAAAFGR